MQSKKHILLHTQILSLLSLMEYRSTLNESEVTESMTKAASDLKANLERYPNPIFWCTQQAFSRLCSKLNHSAYESTIDNIQKMMEEMKPNSSRRVSEYQEKPLEQQSEKELRAKRRFNINSYDFNSDEEYDSAVAEQEKIRELLSKKEHVLTPAQSKLIRKMSIHAGEKLTLQQAQKLQNKLKAKA